MRINKNLFMGIVALSLSPIVLANHHIPTSTDTWVPGAYVGLQGGYGITNLDDIAKVTNEVVNNNLLNKGYNYKTHFTIENADSFAGRIYTGYDFHKNLAIELGYSYLFSDPYLFSKETNKMNEIKIQICEAIWVADLVGIIKTDLIDNFGVFAKLGINLINFNYHDQDYNGKNARTLNIAYGAGIYYKITQNTSIDASWAHYNGNDSYEGPDVYEPRDCHLYSNLFTIGVKHKFGGI